MASLVENLSIYSFSLGNRAYLLREDALTHNSWAKACGARLLFLAQMIVSIGAWLSIALLATCIRFIAVIMQCCAHDTEHLGEFYRSLGNMLLLHLSLIPTCLIAACVPHSCEWSWPADRLVL